MHHYAGSPIENNYGRPFFLAQAFREKGNNCRVIGASFHHLMRHPQTQTEKVLNKKIENLNCTWIKTPKYKGNGLKRFINMFCYSFRLRFTNLVKEYDIEKPDIIIVSTGHPFHFFAGHFWAKKYGAKLVYEVRDLWPLSLNYLLNLSTKHPLSILLSWIEKKAYRNSDQVISLLPNAAKHMIALGLDPNKFNYIPNGVKATVDGIYENSCHSDYLTNLKRNGGSILIYTGAHGVPNALMPLIEAAQIIDQRNKYNIQIVLIGNGISKPELRKYSEENKIKNLHFLSSLKRSQIPDTLNLSDAAYLGWQDSNLYKYGISPNKLFEYMFAAKPILMAGAHHGNPLEDSKAGICVYSSDPEKIADAIISLFKLSKNELDEMGANGKQYVDKHHTYDVLAQQYIYALTKETK